MRSVKIFSSYKSHFCCRLKHCFQKWFPVCAKNALFLAEAKFASREVQLNVNYISLARYKKHFWKQWLDNLYRSKTLTPAWKYSYFSGYARNEHEIETDAGISLHLSHARSSPSVKKPCFVNQKIIFEHACVRSKVMMCTCNATLHAQFSVQLKHIFVRATARPNKCFECLPSSFSPRF